MLKNICHLFIYVDIIRWNSAVLWTSKRDRAESDLSPAKLVGLTSAEEKFNRN